MLAGMLTGLPALLGVAIGVLTHDRGGFGLLAVIALIAAVFPLISRPVVRQYPLLWLTLIELSSLVLILTSTSLATRLALAVTVFAPTILTGPPDESRARAAALAGALTTYLANAWMKDMEKGEGPLLPSTQFKNGLSAVFSGSKAPIPPETVDGDSRLYDALYLPTVRAEGNVAQSNGWGLLARWERAHTIARALKLRKRK